MEVGQHLVGPGRARVLAALAITALPQAAPTNSRAMVFVPLAGGQRDFSFGRPLVAMSARTFVENHPSGRP